MASENFEKLKQLTEELVDRDFFLKRRQEMLEKLLVSTPTPVIVWVVDKDLKFITNAGNLPGVIPDDGLGESLYEYFNTTDDSFYPISLILQTLQDTEISYTLDHKGRHLWTKCSPMKDYEGKVVGIIGVTWDFTRIYDAIDLLDALLAEDKVSKKIHSKIVDMRSVLLNAVTTKQKNTE